MKKADYTESLFSLHSEDAFSVTALSAKLKIPPTTIYQWIEDGTIKAKTTSENGISISFEHAKEVFFGTHWWPDPTRAHDCQYTLNLTQAAHFIGCSQYVLRVRIMNGDLASRRIGHRYLLRIKDLVKIKTKLLAESRSPDIPIKASEAEKLITTTQAAEAIGCVTPLVHYWVAHGIIPARRSDYGTRLSVSAQRVNEIIELLKDIRQQPEKGQVTAKLRRAFHLQPVRRGRSRKISPQVPTE